MSFDCEVFCLLLTEKIWVTFYLFFLVFRITGYY